MMIEIHRVICLGDSGSPTTFAEISTSKQIQKDWWKLRVSQKCKFLIVLKPDGGTTRVEDSDQPRGLM